jgi:flavin-binding protein dodecin
MSEHVYKGIELVGAAPDSIEAAIDNALARAGESLHNLRWFEVTETRGNIEDGRVAHYQVGLKVGFSLDAGSGAG